MTAPSFRHLLTIVESLGPSRTAETVSPRLWHGTTLNGLYAIMAEDCLHPGHADGGPPGVSLTRSYEIADDYATERQRDETRDSYPQDFEAIPPGVPVGAVIEIDGPALIREGYTVRPFVWDSASGAEESEEAEDRVLRRPIKPLSAVMTAFYVSKTDLLWYAELHKGDVEVSAAMQSLIEHPKRKEP